MNKEVRELIKSLEAQGFEVRAAKSGHYKVYKDGVYVATLPATPSDTRSLRNVTSVLRRVAGYKPKRK